VPKAAGPRLTRFNRVPVAGRTNIERLKEMLDEAGIAFIILRVW
jgi:hypothetical protein